MTPEYRWLRPSGNRKKRENKSHLARLDERGWLVSRCGRALPWRPEEMTPSESNRCLKCIEKSKRWS